MSESEACRFDPDARLGGDGRERPNDLLLVGGNFGTQCAVEATNEVAEPGFTRLVVGNPAIGAQKRSIHAPILRTRSANCVSPFDAVYDRPSAGHPSYVTANVQSVVVVLNTVRTRDKAPKVRRAAYS